MKLQIPVEKWLHDRADAFRDGLNFSYLLRSDDGKQCCMGIYLEACGVPRAELQDQGLPSCLDESFIPPEAKWTLDDKVAERIAAVNDGAENDFSREKIAELFAEHGVEVEFVEASNG